MQTRITGRRVQTARASSRGIEDIIMEMPSRSLGTCYLIQNHYKHLLALNYQWISG